MGLTPRAGSSPAFGTMFFVYALKSINHNFIYVGMTDDLYAGLSDIIKVMSNQLKDLFLSNYSITKFVKMVSKPGKEFKVPPKWDGKAAERIWEILLRKV